MSRTIAVLLGSLIAHCGVTPAVGQATVVVDPQAATAQTRSGTTDPARPEWASWSASPHHSSRGSAPISAVIVHYTAGGALESTVGWFRNPDAKASSHYVVGRSGQVVQMVDLDRAAWHAGKSELGGKEGVNAFSIGIEVCNWGKLTKHGDDFFTYTGNRYQGETPYRDAQGQYWEPFTEAQYAAIAKICDESIEQFEISHITGHSDIALPIGRKIDPGSAFDWPRLKEQLSGPYAGAFGTIAR